MSVWVEGLGFGCLGIRVECLGIRVERFAFVQGCLGIRVERFGLFRVEGFGFFFLAGGGKLTRATSCSTLSAGVRFNSV